MKVYYLSLSTALTAAFLSLLMFLSLNVSAVSVVAIDEASMDISDTEPRHDQKITVAVPITFVQCEPAGNGIVLSWFICTKDNCDLPKETVMILNSTSGMWEASIGPFPEEDAQGEPYIDVKFHVEAAGNRSDGTPGQVSARSTEVQLDFEHAQDDDDDNGNDSPIGGIVPLVCILLLGALFFRKRKE